MPGWTEAVTQCFKVAQLINNYNVQNMANFYGALAACQPESRLTDIFAFNIASNVELFQQLLA
jgi:hypothetical protein